MAWWLRWCWLVCLCVMFGCYKHHRREDASVDAGDSDVAVFVDAGDEAGLDASADGSIDSGDAMVLDGGDSGLLDSGVDAGCSARVPEDFPTLQDAIDLTPCDPIIVTQDQNVSSVNVHRSVTITTPDAAQRTIQGDGSGSVFIVPSSISVTLERLVISGGRASSGAGIMSQGELILRGVTVAHNEASTADDSVAAVGGGGLMQMGGSLRMGGEVVFDGNTANGPQALGGALWLGAAARFQGHLLLRDNTAFGAVQAHGGAIAMFNGSLTGDRLTLQNNEARLVGDMAGAQGLVLGGAVAMYGSTLRATQSAIDGNSVGVQVWRGGEGQVTVSGGAIYCSHPGVVDLSNGAATNNTAHASAAVSDAHIWASGGFLASTCDVSLDTFSAEANTASVWAEGGGIAQANGGALDLQYATHTITRSILRSNRAGVIVGGSMPSPGSPLFGMRSWAVGGAVFAGDARLSVVDSLIANNTTTFRFEGASRAGDEVGGGGIALRSANNQNLSGPNAVTIVRSSIVENNISVDGFGALEASGAGLLVQGRSLFPFPVRIESSTIASNRILAYDQVDAVARGAAIAMQSDADPPLSLALSNVTIARNNLQANTVAAAAISVTSSTTPLMVETHDSIMWGNTLRDMVVDDCEGAVLSGAHNIVSDTGCFSGSDVTNRSVDPELQLMTMVSDRCQVLPIATSSPAHNGGSPGRCSAPNGDGAIDQCGRPRHGACDIGALEAQP